MTLWQLSKKKRKDRNNNENNELILNKNQLKQTHLKFSPAVQIKLLMRVLNQKNRLQELMSSQITKM